MKKNTYETTEFYLASFLMGCGLTLKNVERINRLDRNNNKCKFVFYAEENDALLSEAMQTWVSVESEIVRKSLISASSLKNLIRQELSN